MSPWRGPSEVAGLSGTVIFDVDAPEAVQDHWAPYQMTASTNLVGVTTCSQSRSGRKFGHEWLIFRPWKESVEASACTCGRAFE